MQTDAKKFFPALTGFRAVAAWMIFVLHFLPKNTPWLPEVFRSAIHQFHIGVDMFFVLSGFLIAYRYFDQTPLKLRTYFVNRFARIYPMYFLITVGVFADYLLRYRTWTFEKTTEALLSFSMTKALFDKYLLTAGISQGWTLTLEEMFYFTAPFYFLLLRRKRFWLVLLPVAIFIFGTALKYLTQIPANSWGFMQENISVYIFEFFSGIALALLVRMQFQVKKGFPFATFFGLVVIAVYLFWNPFSFFTSPDFLQALMVIFLSCFGIVPLFWGLIHENSFIQKILSGKMMVLLGKSSYIFYLIHKGFIPMFIYDFIAQNVALIFILLNILSIIMFKYLEEPLNQFFRKKLA